ncbi:hypothetical protein [Nostoc sp.]|uniref:hypothetical protein n=1 Tax=Nostoc sp. TaxID=1180 RepID=UPI002FF1BACF
MKLESSKIEEYLKVGKLAKPKLTLYAFQLRYNLAQGTKHQVNDANHLWIKCQEISKKIGIPKLESLPALIAEQNSQLSNINGSILPERILSFTAIEHKKHLHLRGEVHPLQIHDTYALDLTLRYPEPEVEIADLSGLNPDNCLLPNNINASLGQTLVLFAQPLGDIQNEQAFADACVMALLSTQTYQNLKIKCQFQGKLLGSPIYEYNNDADSPQEQCHILIWLNTNSQTTQLENDGEYYYPLINLLNYRSKIIYAHSQAIWCNQQAREEYSKLESKVIDFNYIKSLPVSSKLDKFSLWLNEIPEISFNYARQLRDLQIHKNTIQTNCKNYHLELDKINNIWLQDNDLIFLSIFGKLAEDTYVEQINTDLGYLQPSQNLFDQMINTIRGIVEIEQAKRDRSLERTIQVLGIAFGGGAIVSGVVTQHIDKPFAPQINFKYPVHPLVSSLLWSVLATAIFGIVAWWVTKPKPKRNKQK